MRLCPAQRRGWSGAPHFIPAVSLRHVSGCLRYRLPPACATLASPKSRILACPRLRDEDVCGLDVAVDNSLGTVCCVERVGKSRWRVTKRRRRSPAALPRDAVVQRRAIEVLHRDEGSALVLAEVVDGANARVIEGRGGASFAAEAFQGLRVPRHFVRQEL